MDKLQEWNFEVVMFLRLQELAKLFILEVFKRYSDPVLFSCVMQKGIDNQNKKIKMHAFSD